MIDQGEATEKQGKKCETHKEGKNIGNFEHLHTVLCHHHWFSWLSPFQVDVEAIEILTHESNRTH